MTNSAQLFVSGVLLGIMIGASAVLALVWYFIKSHDRQMDNKEFREPKEKG